MASVEFEHVTKKFENGFVAVEDFSLKVEDGELMVLVGPSGCGKSTLLRILAGLDRATTGTLRIDGERVNDLSPQERDIAMVFQSYALYPHMSVRQNIEFGLQLHHLPQEEIDERVRSASELLGLSEMLDRKPKQLSGGQRQRVAMGRALVREPKVFLLDEPLSNLDAKLRVHMRSEIGLLQQRLGTTMLYVTHDQVEAMTMGDRVAVMRDGRAVQVGTPKEIYNKPVNLFVAAFVGSPSMNMAEASLVQDNLGVGLQLGTQRLQLSSDTFETHPGLRDFVNAGGAITVGIRPEDLEDAQLLESRDGMTIEAKIDIVEELGSMTMVHFGVDARAVRSEDAADFQIGSGENSIFVGAFSPRTTAKALETVSVFVDTARLHYFDRATGLAL
jgi:multiple sugar transport system ATP-binding protein